jgi:hypothetical protein
MNHINAQSFSPPDNTFKVFPNPASYSIQLQDDDSKVAKIEIYNIVGKKVDEFKVERKGDEYPISDLAKGLYLVRLYDSYGHVLLTQRISKQTP